jgi:hypothetical protein
MFFLLCSITQALTDQSVVQKAYAQVQLPLSYPTTMKEKETKHLSLFAFIL